MGKSIDIKKPMYISDDRRKSKNKIYIDKIIFEDDFVCLCTLLNGGTDAEETKLLFDKNTGEVLTQEFQFWYVINDKNEIDKKVDEALKFAKDKYVGDSNGLDALLLGDVAKLITIITEIEVSIEDIRSFF